MVESTTNDSTTEEARVSVSESFLEKLLGRSILKSTEPTTEPPKPNDDEGSAAKIMEKLDAMDKKIDSIDTRVVKLEKEEDPNPPEDNDSTPAPGAVGKNDNESEANNSEPPKPNDAVLDTTSVVAKSQELDPDNSTVSTTNDSFMKRTGRNSNGMTW